MKPIAQRIGIALFSLSIILAGSLALASDWPMYRGDPGRTGRSTGVGDITNPVESWKLPLGGMISKNQLWYGDATGSGETEFAIVEGNRIVLKTEDNHTIWTSDIIGDRLVIKTAVDFDLNGSKELVVGSSGSYAGIYLIDSSNGQTLWKFNGFTGHTNFGVFNRSLTVADIDQDEYPELLAIAGNSCETIAFSFKNGFSNTVEDNIQWWYAHEHSCTQNNLAVGDIDNNGTKEIVIFEGTRLTILNGESGSLKSAFNDFMVGKTYGGIFIENVDDDSQNEIIGLQSSAGSETPGIVVFDAYEMKIQWQYQWPTQDEKIVFTANSLSDVTGDGNLEIIASIYDNTDNEWTTGNSTQGNYDNVNEPSTWSTVVFDAAVGSYITHIADSKLQAVVDMDGDGASEIVVAKVIPGSPICNRFGVIESYGIIEPNHKLLWRLENVELITTYEKSTGEKNTFDILTTAGKADTDNNGSIEMMVLSDSNSDNKADELQLIEVSSEDAVVKYKIETSPNEQIKLLYQGLNVAGLVDNTYFIFSRSEGLLDFLSIDLLSNFSLNVSNFNSLPIIADFNNDGLKEIALGGSNGELRLYKTNEGYISTPPQKSWTYYGGINQSFEAFDLDNDGKFEFPVINNLSPTNPVLQIADSEGEIIWSTVFQDFSNPPIKVLNGQFSTSPQKDLLVSIIDQREDSTHDLRLIALEGSNGDILWNISTNQNYWKYFTPHIADVNNDNYDDIIFYDATNIEYYSGVDGSLIKSTPGSPWSPFNIMADFDNDGLNEFITTGNSYLVGVRMYELLADDPSWILQHNMHYEVYPLYLGVYKMENGLGFIKPTTTGYLAAYDNTATPIWDSPVYPRTGGLLIQDPQDSVSMGSVTVADINGDGEEEALVAGSDGFLYAIRISDKSLVWSMDIGGYAKDIVAADADNDGALEILISTGDGYLRMIDQQGLPASSSVRDLELDSDLHPVNPETDIDESETALAIGASWDPVIGADGYLITVLDADGKNVTSPLTVKSADPTAVHGRFLPGESYAISVTAFTEDGLTGAPARSDGFTIINSSPPSISDLQVAPEVFNPNKIHASITANLYDQTMLKRYAVRISAEDEATIRSYTKDLNSKEEALIESWDGKDALGNIASDGDYTITVTVFDQGGLSAEVETTTIIDTNSPEAPEIISPEDGSILSVEFPTFSGSSEPGTLVTVKHYRNKKTICTSIAGPDANFTCESESPLSDKSFKVVATAEDAAGNISPDSATVSFTIDTNPETDGDDDGGDDPGWPPIWGCSSVHDKIPGAFAWMLLILLGLAVRRRAGNR